MADLPFIVEERSVWIGNQDYGRVVKLRTLWARTLPGVWTVLHCEEVG